MSRKIEINPGDVYGRLTIIKEVEKRNKWGRRQVEAYCSCDNNIGIYLLNSLRIGATTSCGCYKTEIQINKREDVIGETFGRLTVIEDLGINSYYKRRILAQCYCDGNIKEYFLDMLKRGTTTSCGCFRYESIKEKQTYHKKDHEERYPFFCQIEETMDDPDGYGILVRCKKCNEWFRPTASQLYGRIYSLEKPNGFKQNYFYCSDGCRHNCPLYNLKSDPFEKKNNKQMFTDYELNIFAEEVKHRQFLEFGYNFCEYGDCRNPGPYHTHHERPKSVEWIFALDPDNGIVFCSEHHYSIGHSGECSTGALAHNKCSKVIDY